MLRMLALIGFCATLTASAVQAGSFHLQYGPVHRGHDGHRGGERGFRDRDVVVIDRHGDRWRGDVRRFGDGAVVVIDPRGSDRFGDDRRSGWGRRGGRHGGFRGEHRGFRGHALTPQQRHRLWTR